MKYLKFILITAFCFLQILCCSVKKPDLGKNKVNIDKNKVEVELIYNFGEVSIVDAKIDNSHLYTTFHNIYNGNISSWGHLCLIDLKNNKNIKRSNVLYNPKRIVEIIDDMLFLHCSHDIIPFEKESLNVRKIGSIGGDSNFAAKSNERFYFYQPPIYGARIFCVSRSDKKVLWQFPSEEISHEIQLFSYVLEKDNKVFVFMQNRPEDDRRLFLVVLDAGSGKEIKRQYLFSPLRVGWRSDIKVIFEDNIAYILTSESSQGIELIAYSILPDGRFEKKWKKIFKGKIYYLAKENEKYVQSAFTREGPEFVVDDKFVYIPIEEGVNKATNGFSGKILSKTLYTLDRKTGKIIWKYKFKDSGRFENWIKQTNSTIENDKIILTTFDTGKDYYSSSFFFHCLDRKNGKLIWQKKFSNSDYQQIVLKEDRLWVIQEEKKSHSIILNIIDVNTGNVLCSFEPEKIKAYDIYYANNEILPYNRNDAIFVLGDGRVYSIKLI